MSTRYTIFRAREIVTMNPSNPAGTLVAVRDGRILGVGTALDEFAYWGDDYDLDDTFADKVLLPGFVEAHSHILEGGLSQLPYIGYFPRHHIDGTTIPACTTLNAFITRLGEIEATMPPGEPLIAWGFDPIYFTGERLNRNHLDQVSATRPIFIVHASLHLATVNSALLDASGITAETETEGVEKDPDGAPTGELQETPAMMLAGPLLYQVVALAEGAQAWRNLGAAARNAGITTLTDLANTTLLDPAKQAVVEQVVNDPDYPARLVLYPAAIGAANYDALAGIVTAGKARDTDKMRTGGIKLVADGSIQGFTAVLNWPGYASEEPGIWNVTPDQMAEAMAVFHGAGINVHCHCNGDAVIDTFIEAVDQACRQHSWLDHRHTVQHSQLTTRAQLRKMANLGMAANIFTNHIWYWGDQHYEITVGPERANRMEPCASAKREGVRFALHTDAAVTPLGSLHLMWCAVNRVTPSGRVLGEHEKISAYDALQAVTVDAAYQLHMDHEIGSIEVGKHADFAVLDANPLEVDPMAIRDIGVWGTVVGGVPFPAPVPA